MLAHLEEIDKSWSERIENRSKTINECLLHACMSGLIDDTEQCRVDPDNNLVLMHKLRDDDEMEHVWEDFYQKCRSQWKLSTDQTTMPDASNTLPASQAVFNALDPCIMMNFNDTTEDLPITEPSFEHISSSNTDTINAEVDPDMVAAHWSLNTEQKIAY